MLRCRAHVNVTRPATVRRCCPATVSKEWDHRADHRSPDHRITGSKEWCSRPLLRRHSLHTSASSDDTTSMICSINKRIRGGGSSNFPGCHCRHTARKEAAPGCTRLRKRRRLLGHSAAPGSSRALLVSCLAAMQPSSVAARAGGLGGKPCACLLQHRLEIRRIGGVRPSTAAESRLKRLGM